MRSVLRSFLLFTLSIILSNSLLAQQKATTHAIQQTSRPIITPENAHLVTELAVLGRGTIHDLAWSPDGNTIALAGSRGVWLLDYTDLAAEPRLLEGHTEVVLAVDFHPDGEVLASASRDGTVRLWNVESGEEIVQLGPTSGLDVAFSPDGRLIAAPSEPTHNATVRESLSIWDSNTLEEIASLPYRGGPISTITFFIDSQTVIVGTDSMSDAPFGTIIEFDLATLEITEQIEVSAINELALNPDETELSVAMYFEISNRMLDVAESQTLVDTLRHFAGTTVDYSRDGQWLAYNSDGLLKIWNTETTTLVFQINESAQKVRFSPDGRVLSAIVGDEIKFWTVGSWTQIAAVNYFTSSINALAISPNGQFLIAAHVDNKIAVWWLDTVSLFTTITAPSSSISLNFHPDGTIFYSGHSDGTVTVWNAATFQLIETVQIIQQPIHALGLVALEEGGSKDLIVGEGILHSTNAVDPSIQIRTFGGDRSFKLSKMRWRVTKFPSSILV